MVSPPNAGNVSLEAGGPYAPLATSPSRFAFGGYFGTIEGTGDPTGVGRDLYVATRSSGGWVTRYVGIPGTETASAGGPPIEGYSFDVSPLVRYPRQHRPVEGDRLGPGPGELHLLRSAGVLRARTCGRADGSPLGRLPTNLAEVPESELDISKGGFKGGVGISPDFSHYFFSASIPFADRRHRRPPGSAYDNDIATGSVTLISKTATGDDIPGRRRARRHHYIEFPAISTDGSHVLMSTEGAGGNKHLYMAVDDVHHYDVSVGTDGLDHAGRPTSG